MDEEPPKPIDVEQPPPPPEKQWVYGTPEELRAADPWRQNIEEEARRRKMVARSSLLYLASLASPFLLAVPGLSPAVVEITAGFLWFLFLASSTYLAKSITKDEGRGCGLSILFIVAGPLIYLAIVFAYCATHPFMG